MALAAINYTPLQGEAIFLGDKLVNVVYDRNFNTDKQNEYKAYFLTKLNEAFKARDRAIFKGYKSYSYYMLIVGEETISNLEWIKYQAITLESLYNTFTPESYMLLHVGHCHVGVDYKKSSVEIQSLDASDFKHFWNKILYDAELFKQKIKSGEVPLCSPYNNYLEYSDKYSLSPLASNKILRATGEGVVVGYKYSSSSVTGDGTTLKWEDSANQPFTFTLKAPVANSTQVTASDGKVYTVHYTDSRVICLKDTTTSSSEDLFYTFNYRKSSPANHPQNPFSSVNLSAQTLPKDFEYPSGYTELFDGKVIKDNSTQKYYIEPWDLLESNLDLKEESFGIAPSEFVTTEYGSITTTQAVDNVILQKETSGATQRIYANLYWDETNVYRFNPSPTESGGEWKAYARLEVPTDATAQGYDIAWSESIDSENKRYGIMGKWENRHFTHEEKLYQLSGDKAPLTKTLLEVELYEEGEEKLTPVIGDLAWENPYPNNQKPNLISRLKYPTPTFTADNVEVKSVSIEDIKESKASQNWALGKGLNSSLYPSVGLLSSSRAGILEDAIGATNNDLATALKGKAAVADIIFTPSEEAGLTSFKILSIDFKGDKKRPSRTAVYTGETVEGFENIKRFALLAEFTGE